MSKNRKNSTFYFLLSTFSQKGFTLLETIIYIALFSLVTSFVMAVFFQLIVGEETHRSRVEVDSEANFMMQKIAWALTGASAINQPTGGATSSVLSVNKSNYAQNPVIFDRGSMNLRISKSGGEPIFLGSSRVFVDEFIAEHLPSAQGQEGVKIKLTVVSSNIARPRPSTTLETTIYLR